MVLTLGSPNHQLAGRRLRQICAQTLHHYESSGLTRTITAWANSNRSLPLQTPDAVLYEKAMITYCLAATAIGRHSLVEIVPTVERVTFADQAVGLHYLLKKSIPYLWLDDLRMAALTSGGLPNHIVDLTSWPNDTMWFTWESDIIKDNRKGVGAIINKVYAPDGSINCINMVEVNELDESIIQCNCFGLAEQGMSYPDDFPNENSRMAYEAHAKMIGFINSPYIEQKPTATSRSFRRRAEKEGHQDLQSPVTVVTLRRAQPSKVTNGDSPNSYHEYNWRWIVSGHWRNQWYSTSSSHKIIWIAPYLKGPDDAPLKTTVYKVAR